jgi:hypothetical protein
MKQIILASTALMFSSTLIAGVFDAPFEVGNPDLYSGTSDSSKLPTAVQPGIGDAYASQLLPGGVVKRPHVHKKGANDGYGSILIDVGHDIDW